MNLLSCDPGKQGWSWSYWYAGFLTAGGVLPLKGSLCDQASEALSAMLVHTPWVQHIAIERMTYYPQRSSAKGSSEIAAILDLQAVGNLVAGYYRVPVTHYRPAEWMGGSLPHHIVKARVEAALTPAEAEVFERILAATRKDLRHNAYDSAGIGLSHLGRFGL